MRSKLSRIVRDIETLATFTSTPTSGVTRLPFTPEDRKAREYIKCRMMEAGLEIEEDGVGTILGRRNGTMLNAPTIMIGSHYDSVKNGGAFDGVAGIIAALEVVRVFNDEGIMTKYPIEVVAMNDEEGIRFKSGMLSSRAMVGSVAENELDVYVDDDNISIRQAMINFGTQPDLKKAKREKNSIRAFLELHIEQGPILETNKKDIGIIKKIVGLAAYKVIISGKAGHAGTTPMEQRIDALLAASKAILKLNEIVKEVGNDSVGTVGELYVLPGAANVIPGMVEFTMDVRSADEEKIREVFVKFKKELELLENDLGVKANINETFYAKPVELSKTIMNCIEEEAVSLGYESLFMNSGAGHDAMIMAEYVPTGMIFIPSKNGISHTSEEWTDYEKIQNGVEVLLNTVIALDQKK